MQIQEPGNIHQEDYRLGRREIWATLVGSFIFFQVYQGPGSPIALASYLADYDRRVREAHNMDSVLERGLRLRDFPQWVMQQNVLA
jgi:hypothetical protein